MPSAVLHCRGGELRCHSSQHLQLGRNFTHVVIAAAKDGNIVERQPRLDSFLKKQIGHPKIVEGGTLDIERFFQKLAVSINVNVVDVLLDLRRDRLRTRSAMLSCANGNYDKSVRPRYSPPSSVANQASTNPSTKHRRHHARSNHDR